MFEKTFKYLDALEHDKAAEAELEGKRYTFILPEVFRWESWAAPARCFGGSHLTGNNAALNRPSVAGRWTHALAMNRW